MPQWKILIELAVLKAEILMRLWNNCAHEPFGATLAPQLDSEDRTEKLQIWVN